MEVRRRVPEVPDWVVKLVLGGAAVGVGGYLLYELLAGPAAFWRDQLEYWIREYAKEYREFVEEGGGTLTAEQEEILRMKAERVAEASRKYMEVSGRSWDAVRTLIVGGILAAVAILFPYERVARAVRYVRDSSQYVQSGWGGVMLLREAVNVAFADVGYVTIATAAHLATEAATNTYVYPAMQSYVAYLQSQLPTLTGLALQAATITIQGTVYDMSFAIPLLLNLAGTLLLI